MRRLPGESLAQLAARARAERAAPAGAPTGGPAAWDDDLVPSVGDGPRSAEQYEMDAVLARVDILDAYRLWCAKMEPKVGNKREGIMVSCPNPAHPDAHPSAWLNLDIGDGGVGNCDPCGMGFDKYDLAAWHFGFDVPGYKHTGFPELRRRMAEGLGYRVMVQGKAEWLEKVLQPSEVVPTAAPAEPSDEPVLTLADESTGGMDWRHLGIEPGTFLHEWMSTTSELYEPEEFYLWLGLAALGLAVGNRVTLDDEPKVRANMLTCLIGSTGTGKSRAINNFYRLICEGMPWNGSEATGVRIIDSSGSGEAMLDQFVHTTTDPADKTLITERPVVGLYIEDEFEGLMARINKPTSTFRPYLMKFFDSPNPVSTNSRTHGSKVARGHFMQMVSSTQPARLSDLTSSGDASSGFLNRWFFVFGTEKNRPALSRVRLDLRRSVDLLRDVRAWSGNGRSVRFIDEAANKTWCEFVATRIRPVEASEAQLAARIELQCKKLLLLWAINDRLTTVSQEHLHALQLIFPYLLRCYSVVERRVGLSEVEGCVRAIRGYFESHPNDAITARVLGASSGARRWEQTVRQRALELLMLSNEVEEIPRDRNARATKYRLVKDAPALTSVDTG